MLSDLRISCFVEQKDVKLSMELKNEAKIMKKLSFISAQLRSNRRFITIFEGCLILISIVVLADRILSNLSGMASSNVPTGNVRVRITCVMETTTVATEVMNARAPT